jgi:hypothetical protein
MYIHWRSWRSWPHLSIDRQVRALAIYDAALLATES